MVELLLTLAISAFLSLLALKEMTNKSIDNLAYAAGTHIRTVTQAVEAHILKNWAEYEAGTDVAGVAVDLRPTITELIALGRLRAGFPQMTYTRQQLRIDITKTNCPGSNCLIQATVCTTTPVTLGATSTRFDLATLMMEEQAGHGGISYINDGANIKGAILNIPNPVGNVEGIVCGGALVDTGAFANFVRLRDTRDPDLQGNLTVAGTTSLNGPTFINNNMDVGGTATFNSSISVAGSATFGPCINFDNGGNQGRAGFGCTNPDDVPPDYTGGVRTPDLVASNNVLATNNPLGFTGDNGNYALITANNGTGVAEIRTSGRVAGDRLTPRGLFMIDQPCDGSEEGSIGRWSDGPGLVTCTLGSWRLFTTQSTAYSSCAPLPNGSTVRDDLGRTLVCINNSYQPLDEIFRTGTVNSACQHPGTTAIDTTSNNETLICRINLAGGTARWMRLRDVTAHMVFVRAEETSPDATVAKPNCNGAPSQSPTAVIQLIPKVWGSPDGGQAFFAVDNGASWTIRLRDGSGATLQGTPNAAAIAQIFCYFP